MAVVLRGRLVEGDPAGEEETTGFNLEDAQVVEATPENAPDFDPEGETINLDLPASHLGETWAGNEVEVEGRFEQEGGRWVLVVERIDEV